MQYSNRVITSIFVLFLYAGSTAWGQPAEEPDNPPDPGSLPGKAILNGLETVSANDWDTAAVRRVLQAFAFGGHASDAQIEAWASMTSNDAIIQMLNFRPVNRRLSAPGRGALAVASCTSLTDLQALWSSDDSNNPMRVSDRPYYSLLNEDQMQLSPLGLFLVWSRAMHTRGCNLFLHKMAFYLTNYHASIHVRNAGVALIRDYYDDTIEALASGSNFIDLMYNAASNGALALAYGHFSNYVDPRNGQFHGNDDFAREYFQLLFGIQGTTEDEDYHENVSIENNALLLTGMFLDMEPDRFASLSRLDWFLSTIDFSDHVDATGRQIYNRTAHFDFRIGALSCLEILHEKICGGTAPVKLRALGLVAAAHPESMANTPLKIIRFFADNVITADEALALQTAWAHARFRLLKFIRAYAISTMFHSSDTFKYWSAFERNLIIYNATILNNEESFARPFFASPVVQMYDQGALAFAPIRDVFGGQTGNDAANDRYVFKNAWGANVDNPDILAVSQLAYQLEPDGASKLWQKNWGAVIPSNSGGEHIVSEVAKWLWNRFIPDGGENFDPVARAQVHALLATGFDFAAVVNRADLDAIFSSADIVEGPAAEVNAELAVMPMNFGNPDEQLRVGMAINFITMLPYTFASGGVVE